MAKKAKLEYWEVFGNHLRVTVDLPKQHAKIDYKFSVDYHPPELRYAFRPVEPKVEFYLDYSNLASILFSKLNCAPDKDTIDELTKELSSKLPKKIMLEF